MKRFDEVLKQLYERHMDVELDDYRKESEQKIPKVEKEVKELEKKLVGMMGPEKRKLQRELKDKKELLAVLKGYVKDKYGNLKK